ncbi:MAG: carboxymuconolactone decarboxylase family protein [Candidatus Saliniplasma sp.]
MSDVRENIRDFKRAKKALMENNKEAMGEFAEFMDEVMEENHLDLKTKELIALTNGITARCKYCIDIHTQSALEAGATREEILEAAFVAIMMGGGPAMTYVAELKKALDEFE